MVEDVVAWLPHSPMLAFDILQNMVEALVSLHVLFISLMCSPSSWATEDDPSIILPFYSFSSVQEILPLTNFVSLQQNK
jgi:hypothetical protein